MRSLVTMACTDCQERNYTTSKNKKSDAGRIELRKFCSRCGHHTLHRETR